MEERKKEGTEPTVRNNTHRSPIERRGCTQIGPWKALGGTTTHGGPPGVYVVVELANSKSILKIEKKTNGNGV